MQAEKGRQPPYFSVCTFRSHTVTNYIAPTGNLDQKNSKEIIDLLKLSNRNLKQTILLITHDEKIALETDRIVTMEDGKIISDEWR